MSPNSKPNRERPVVHLTLSPEAIAICDELAIADGMSRSAKVEQLLRQTARTHGLNVEDLGGRERKARRMSRRRAT